MRVLDERASFVRLLRIFSTMPTRHSSIGCSIRPAIRASVRSKYSVPDDVAAPKPPQATLSIALFSTG
ncbi:hypothetical protein SBC1_57520 (plasmid) [Caballeronia sp. SBC1]|nr:hypothetical protein SBC2_57130 [Caballeronia sp. SBC2]QIN65706.1 hypothetical protein SBC1_57520 [Caballeronia sp. SBC1]